MTSALETVFKLAYQISPIILTDGVASAIPGGMLPIVSITESVNFVTGLLSGGDVFELDRFFAHFRPIPGGTLVDNQVALYPFANQQVAANAVIVQPNRISMLMSAPASGEFGYAKKLATMMALKAVLDQHNITGGTYTVVTPAYLYENCVMTGLRDVSSLDNKQPQAAWQFDFVQPLVTLAQAEQAQNSLMSRIGSGGKVTPGAEGEITWSGPASGVGIPSSGLAPSVVPAARPLAGASVGSNNLIAAST